MLKKLLSCLLAPLLIGAWLSAANASFAAAFLGVAVSSVDSRLTRSMCVCACVCVCVSRQQGAARSEPSHLLRLLPGADAPPPDGSTESDQVAPPGPPVQLGCPARSQYLQKGRLRSVQAASSPVAHCRKVHIFLESN